MVRTMRRAMMGVAIVGLVALAAPSASATSGGRTAQTTSNPDQLQAVSCTSATACTAVGEDPAGDNAPLAERWDGTSWSVLPTPNATGTEDGFDGVSCVSATVCTAVGYADPTSPPGPRVTLAESWNGTSWTPQATPNPTGSHGNILRGVSCVSPTACFAVGISTVGIGTIAEVWNGTGWSMQTAPTPAGQGGDDLFGVSCTPRISPTACIAVGSFSKGTFGSQGTLAERWNGTRWFVQPTPTADGDELDGVSCASQNVCTAVGTSGGDTGLVERFAGTKWTVQSTPSLSGQSVSLLAVSCTSATACIAVGFSQNASNGREALAERWNGSTWTILSTPNPSGVTQSMLLGVSCTSASACTAVGNDLAGNNLAERWNGSKWTIQPMPS
jgi:hypothetical protein